jgi:3-oxoacyl-[acyl-carrier protein] reductase
MFTCTLIFHLCRAALPLMRPRKEGAIVLISSTAGLRAVHTNIAYQVVKGAIPHFAVPWPANVPMTIFA